MSYYPCASDDDALHKRFHAKSVGGVDFKPTILDARKSKVVWRGREEEQEEDSFVLVVDRKSAAVERRKAREVLEVVESELSAGEIEEGVLWGGVKAGGGSDGGERFRVLLYVVGKKCVGLCLAERIRKAYRVVGDEVRNDVAGEMKSMVYRGSSISVSYVLLCFFLSLHLVYSMLITVLLIAKLPVLLSSVYPVYGYVLTAVVEGLLRDCWIVRESTLSTG